MSSGSMDDITIPEEDLYATLNVKRTASKEEVRAAFQSLSRVFHPDKHSDPQQKESACALFNKIRRAYEILMDDEKRKVYDLFGLSGVEKLSWQISLQQRSSYQLLAEWERIRRNQAKEELYSVTMPSSLYLVGLDATALFDEYMLVPLEERDPDATIPLLPDFSYAMLRQGFQLGVTEQDKVLVSTTAVVRANGRGNAKLRLLWRRSFLTPRWQAFTLKNEIELFKPKGPVACSSVKYHYSNNLSLLMRLSGQYIDETDSLRPGASAKVKAKLSDTLVGSILFNWNRDSKVVSSVTWTQSKHFTSRIDLSLEQENVGVHLLCLTKPLSFWKAKDEQEETEEFLASSSNLFCELRTGVAYQEGLYIACGLKQRVSEHTVVEGALKVAMLQGVQLTLALYRGSQAFRVPIQLSDHVDPVVMVFGVIIPLTSYLFVRRMLYDPWRGRLKQAQRLIKRAELNSYRQGRRMEALKAQELMQSHYQLLLQNEIQRDGLIIRKATYGYCNVYHDVADDGDFEMEVDVTVPLQLMVTDSQLYMPAGSDASARCQLPGFYDPCPECEAEKRRLTIQYAFHSVDYSVCALDSEPVTIPLSD